MSLDREELIYWFERKTLLGWPRILSAKSHEERRVRRVAIWSFVNFLNHNPNDIGKIFGFAARQSIFRILRSKNLSDDEYNLRRELQACLRSRKNQAT
ncbi:MAG: hypothetical protein COV44_00655 [Deltaproteobacteria bacterium CG11_big_fil_rev_8_21_14_0_20_45_16]|nr:MAG: hypothetical protein COV44_00655 [Deltaproteobacteria bacterium CG11_big_fil_rev_8_21_14_0_20_45_16]